MSHFYKIKKKAAYISLTVGLAMFVAKMGAYLITGSAAIFSDAAESVVHIMATAMALFSIILSAKPADKSHLYGHGNIEYFSAGVEGLLIIVAAGVIIFASINDIIYGSNLKKLDTGLLVVTGASAINLILGIFLIRTGKKTNSLTLIADGKHVLTDSYTSLGVLIGIILVMITEFVLFDPIFAFAVALNILYTGYKLIRESVGGLMVETDHRLLMKIGDKIISLKKEYWIDLHELRFWKSGEQVFIDFHLILPYYFTIKQSHTEESQIKSELIKAFPSSQIKIHFDYCIQELCKYCNYQECQMRSQPCSMPFELNINKLTGKPVYLINKSRS
ncbi:MAG: cation diffusion facilitator family transporter [Ignavibacteria bacterium]